MVIQLYKRWTMVFFLMACITVALQNQEKYNTSFRRAMYRQIRPQREVSVTTNNNNVERPKRLIKKPLGFFATIGQLIFEQYNETTSAYRQITKLVNDGFADPNDNLTTTTMSSDPNATTTEAPYRITREELFAILRRNLRGLNKLLKLEINDALNQTNYNLQDIRKDFGNEIGKIVG